MVLIEAIVTFVPKNAGDVQLRSFSGMRRMFKFEGTDVFYSCVLYEKSEQDRWDVGVEYTVDITLPFAELVHDGVNPSENFTIRDGPTTILAYGRIIELVS